MSIGYYLFQLHIHKFSPGGNEFFVHWNCHQTLKYFKISIISIHISYLHLNWEKKNDLLNAVNPIPYWGKWCCLPHPLPWPSDVKRIWFSNHEINFFCALESTTLRLEGSSFWNRASIYVLKSWYVYITLCLKSYMIIYKQVIINCKLIAA